MQFTRSHFICFAGLSRAKEFTSEINIPLRLAVVVKAQLVYGSQLRVIKLVYQRDPVTASIITVKCGLYDSYGKHHLRFVEITNSMLVHIGEFIDTICVNN